MRHENHFGGMQRDFGEQRVLVNSKGEIVAYGTGACDSCSMVEFRIAIFDQQLQMLSRPKQQYKSVRSSSGGFVQTADGGYILIGTISKPIGDVFDISEWDENSDRDVQILKINASGVLQWHRRFGGLGMEEGVGVQQTADGGYLIAANSQANNAEIQNNTGKRQIWLAKLDVNGKTLWGKLLTNTYDNIATDFKKAKDGNFLLCGGTSDSLLLKNNPAFGNALLMKFNDQGTILWQSQIGGNADDEQFKKICQDKNGNIIVAGSTRSTNLAGQTIRGGSDGWIVKVSNEGSPISMKLLGGSADDHLDAIAISKEGLIVVGGGTLSNDGDVAENVNKYTIWAASYQDGSNISRHGFFGHSAEKPSFIEDIVIDANSNIYCVATSSYGNPFRRWAMGDSDGWIFSIGAPNLVKAVAYVDLNNNGIKEANEKLFSGGRLEIVNKRNPTRPDYFSTATGQFVANIDTGTYAVRFLPHQPYYGVVPAERTVVFPTYGMTDSFMIRLIPNSSRPDVAVSMTPLNIPRPGFEANYVISLANRGNKSAENLVVKLAKDTKLSFTSAIPAVSTNISDTITWNLGSLAPLDTMYLRLTTRIAAPPVTAIGDRLVSQVSVSYQQEDQTPFSSSIGISELVGGSYDPNDKTEFHGGLFPANLLATDKFHYLIRFQNTGTDTAFNIAIRDTLAASLDVTSLEMLAASHPYTLSVKNGNQLEWMFSDVLLPDSNRNEKSSHGFLAFSIKPKQSLKIGDEVTNRASIYFDYNLPIETNTTFTKIVDLSAVLPKPVIAGLESSYCGTDPAKSVKISNMADAGEAKITVKLDGTTISVASNAIFQFEPAKLSIGNHTIEVSFSANGITTLLSTGFRITAPARPVVKLGTSHAVVTNAILILQLTATPVAAGGNTPLYSFSTGRNIPANLQVDGSSNILNISSQILREGENWIYVSMKTSEQCVTGNTAIDSIRIVRNAVTSIVDLNYPASVITAYPNPFNTNLTIQGSQPFTSYMVQLVNASGKVVETRYVDRRTSVTFNSTMLSQGIYFIRLYDKTKQRLIGAIPVMKRL